MKTPPPDLRPGTVSDALETGWGITLTELTYAPLGFGSHHWMARDESGDRWFVTVDDLLSSHRDQNEDAAFTSLNVAFQTAAALRDVANLHFVIGPIPTHDGYVLRRIETRYTLAVFPYLEVVPSEFGAFRTREDRDGALTLVGQVHNATGIVPVEHLRRDTLAIEDRDLLFEAMRSLDEPWTSGPYAEPARRLLNDHSRSIEAAFDRFDSLADSVVVDTHDWVITHGEPHASNVIRKRSGDQVMVDWDTVAFGPRERDLWMIVGDVQNDDWDAYRDVTGVTSLSSDATAAYRLHWTLAEIAIYTAWFRAPHERTEDTETAWDGLQQYVSELA